MKPNKVAVTGSLLLILQSCVIVAQQPENKQAMASTPEALIDILENASFAKPEEYDKKLRDLRARYQHKLNLPILPQILDEKTDPRNKILAKEIEFYANKLTSFAQESKDDGNVLWGRIQGTKYELKAHQWIRDQLKSFGLTDVHYDEMNAQYPQWRPTKIDLEVINAPGFSETETYRFKEALTAFVSALTSDKGVEGELVYVGDGTTSELSGRDLTGKIVLLKGRTLPGAILNTARTAYARIATGKWGKPSGIIVWWDVPFAKQIAGRVGALGGADDIGKAIPWTSIGHSDGLYLRKLLDRASSKYPVRMRLVVQGVIDPPEDRLTANTYAFLPGQVDQYIVLPTHVDSYFYGIHDNGAAVSLNLALAKYYQNLPIEERKYGLVFLFQGDHEVPGVGGTVPFIARHYNLMKNNLLLVLRPEHLGMTQILDEGVYISKTNVSSPLMTLVTNLNKKLIEILTQASVNYSFPIGDFVYQDVAADEAAFHPPYNDLGAVSAGYIQTGKFYHSTADVDLGGVSFDTMEKMARAHAFIIDEVFKLSKEQIHKAEADLPKESVYASELLKIIMGDN